MSDVECFMVEQTDRCRVSLRRFTFSGQTGGRNGRDCPASGYGHHASVTIDDDAPLVTDERGYVGDLGPENYPRDPRWPPACDACDDPFRRHDPAQVNQDRLYAAADGRRFTLRDVPPGAIWDAWWYPWKGPDGRSLCVALPPEGGLDYWSIDGPASSGGKWTREGEPPALTVRPSILTPRYHGFLTAGKLTPT